MEESIISPPRNYPDDVQIIAQDGREFIVVGTAHISQESTDLVKQVIMEEKPDCVCVELDKQRYQTLSDKRIWESLNLKEVIRRKQLTTLLLNLVLSYYQRRLGQKIGVTPGTELLEATKVAKELDISLALCDRDVRITLRRAWRSMSFTEQVKFMTFGMAGFLESPDISEDMLREIRQKDVLTELMRELGEVMPVLKRVLLDERDTYLAQKIRQTDGQKVVAVVGAGHVAGMCEVLAKGRDQDLADIEEVPPASPVGKVIGWGIPILILSALGYIGLSQGSNAAGENILFWVLANSIPSGIGAIVAMAHPLTILAAILAAPLTSLVPVVGVGYVTAFIQAYCQPPVVKELQTVSDDVGQWQQWWQNKFLRIFLVFILTTLGSIIGTYVGAYEIFSNLFL